MRSNQVCILLSIYLSLIAQPIHTKLSPTCLFSYNILCWQKLQLNSIEIEEGGEEVTPAASAGGAIPKQLPRKKKSFDLNSQTDRLWQVGE